MKRSQHILGGLVIFAAAALWAQADNTPGQAAPSPTPNSNSDVTTFYNSDESDTRMLAPPPVSGQAYPIELTSQERSNYLRGGVSFTGAYSDNVLGSTEAHPVSDVSYSVAPMVALDTTTSREHLTLTYAPGFTFYQRISARDEADQNAAIEYDYRLSPHVSFSARDSFQKSSNVFNQPDLTSNVDVSGGAQGANFSVIAPVADRLTNSGNVGLAYQFARNSMIGAEGTFSNLHYPDASQVPGLCDSESQAGLAFYTVRVSKINYFGVTYQYQRLLSYPSTGVSETQTHGALLFYTVYPAKGFSVSLFGGAQLSETEQPSPLTSLRKWTPAGGGSLGWQGRLNSVAVSYLHTIAGGGGLLGAVQLNSASASVRQGLMKTLSASVAGGYAQNDVLGFANLNNGHSITGTASLQQQLLGDHMTIQLGYTRIHQDYGGVAILASTPDTNREFVSVSYQFARALGR